MNATIGKRMHRQYRRKPGAVLCIKCDSLTQHDDTMFCGRCAIEWRAIKMLWGRPTPQSIKVPR